MVVQNVALGWSHNMKIRNYKHSWILWEIRSCNVANETLHQLFFHLFYCCYRNASCELRTIEIEISQKVQKFHLIILSRLLFFKWIVSICLNLNVTLLYPCPVIRNQFLYGNLIKWTNKAIAHEWNLLFFVFPPILARREKIELIGNQIKIFLAIFAIS